MLTDADSAVPYPGMDVEVGSASSTHGHDVDAGDSILKTREDLYDGPDGSTLPGLTTAHHTLSWLALVTGRECVAYPAAVTPAV